MAQDMRPFYQDVQAHYDLSNDFFALFLDPEMVYSCAYFQRDDMSLEEAQMAKIDLALGKCDLRPGMRLLDIGCGWGATVRRAAERYGVDAVGLTLSKAQLEVASRRTSDLSESAGQVEIRLQGWEEFEEPIDRIVSIGAFEHFRLERYDAFFQRFRSLLPDDGRMLLHTIVWHDLNSLEKRGIETTHDNVKFGKFIRKHIFPGGQLCTPGLIVEHAQRAGFDVLRKHSLQLHYARTLDRWAENLSAKQTEAIKLTSDETYDIYMKYLTGCAAHFRSGHLDLMQFTLAVA